MLVSIVIPTRNTANYLRLAIESVLQQTYSNWELHVVDDGSTDETPTLVAEYLKDSRIHYWAQANQERAVARNQGIARSSGKYVAFLDSDDLWHPEKLARQMSILESDLSAALCYTFARYMNAEGVPLQEEPHVSTNQGYVLSQLVRGNFIPISSVIVRRTALDMVGPFDSDPSLIGSEDWDLWLRIAARFPIRLIPEELTWYRLHNTPRSHRVMLSGALAVLEKRFADPEYTRRSQISRQKAKAYAYLCSAGFSSPALARSERLGLLLKGISIAPAALTSSPGLLALARLTLPVSVIGALKRFAANPQH